ncbi:MAG TPA: VOC family protein [Frankiaceae bacterium]|nr:VOC family protein [Frankiaceae bacterium]
MDAWVNNVTIDCADGERLAGFYAALLGREVVWRGAQWVVVGRKRQGEPQLVFQQLPEPTAGKARMHLDLHTDDVEAATARAEELGATRGLDVSEHGMTWRVMADPEGNPVCLTQRSD